MLVRLRERNQISDTPEADMSRERPVRDLAQFHGSVPGGEILEFPYDLARANRANESGILLGLGSE
jgi:hypothetical protein